MNKVTCTDLLHTFLGNISEADQIKSRSEQRYPVPGEPVCVVCGKYGEYICNEVGCEHYVICVISLLTLLSFFICLMNLY